MLSRTAACCVVSAECYWQGAVQRIMIIRIDTDAGAGATINENGPALLTFVGCRIILL